MNLHRAPPDTAVQVSSIGGRCTAELDPPIRVGWVAASVICVSGHIHDGPGRVSQEGGQGDVLVLVTAILSPGSLLGRGGQDAVQLSLGETEVVGIVRP